MEILLDIVGARVILFLSFLMAFGAVIGGAWILFAVYVKDHSDKIYPGVAIFVQNLLIFLRSVLFQQSKSNILIRFSHIFSTLVLKFGRKEDLGY